MTTTLSNPILQPQPPTAAAQPTPITPTAPAPQYPQYVQLETGNSLTSTGAALGAMTTGTPTGAIVGAGAGLTIEMLTAAQKEAARKRELEKQMRLAMLKHRYDEHVARGREGNVSLANNYQSARARKEQRRMVGQDRLNQIFNGLNIQAQGIGAQF